MPRSDIVGPGSVVIAKSAGSTFKGIALPFNVGVNIECKGCAEDSFVVRWMLPGLSKSAAGGQGRKKDVVDIFGEWVSSDDLSLEVMKEAKLPPAIVLKSDVLVYNASLEDGKKVSFELFDELSRVYGIDVTALSVSSTSRGNLCRQYCLMKLNR